MTGMGGDEQPPARRLMDGEGEPRARRLMDGEGEPRARRFMARIAQMPLHRLGIGVGILALAISGLFGGLDRVAKPGIPVVPLGTVDDGAPWNVKVTGAGTAKDVPPLKLEKEGNRWLVIRAEVEVTSDTSRFDAAQVLRIRNADGLLGRKGPTGIPPTRVLLGRDSTDVRDLHPNLPEAVLYFWEQRGDAQVPKELEIEIIGLTQRFNSLSGHLDWLDAEARALVRAPVKDLKI